MIKENKKGKEAYKNTVNCFANNNWLQINNLSEIFCLNQYETIIVCQQESLFMIKHFSFFVAFLLIKIFCVLYFAEIGFRIKIYIAASTSFEI